MKSHVHEFEKKIKDYQEDDLIYRNKHLYYLSLYIYNFLKNYDIANLKFTLNKNEYNALLQINKIVSSWLKICSSTNASSINELQFESIKKLVDSLCNVEELYKNISYDVNNIITEIENAKIFMTELNCFENNKNEDEKCFLTTACMRYMQEKFDDNCYELKVLRWFRDNFVSTDDKNHYYDVAPKIVEAIGKEIDSNLIYNYIYDNVVDFCVTQIENGNYNEAYKRYKDSIQLLEKYYISLLTSDLKNINNYKLK